jgi:hypothetical protein
MEVLRGTGGFDLEGRRRTAFSQFESVDCTAREGVRPRRAGFRLVSSLRKYVEEFEMNVARGCGAKDGEQGPTGLDFKPGQKLPAQ